MMNNKHTTINLYMRANEQIQCADYAFNSSIVSWKQNKTYIHCAEK